MPADVQDGLRGGLADVPADGLGRGLPIRADDRGGAALLHRHPFRPTLTTLGRW